MIEFKDLGEGAAPITVNVAKLVLAKGSDSADSGTNVDLHFQGEHGIQVVTIPGSIVDINAKLLAL